MRDYLKKIEIVGAVLISSGRGVSRYSLDWLYSNCDRICIGLDNWDKKTKNIVMEYQKKYPDKTYIIYSTVPIDKNRNKGSYIKQRFKNYQANIREQMAVKLREMNKKKKIDLLIWPDHDETFLDCFPEYLKKFWYEQKEYSYMMMGFVEVYDKFNIIISQKMAPHARVFRFTPEFSCLPARSRTIQNPYYYSKPYVIRHMIVHMCNFTEEYRKRREYITGRNMMDELKRYAWILPKDVRQMRPEEIIRYQPSPKGLPAEFKPILLKDYIKNKINI